MSAKQKKILLLSPYDTLSHQYWWQGLRGKLPEYQWTILTLEPRYYSWRIRGNSLSWAYEQRELLEQDYDLLIACSLTDLSSLRGFIPKLANIPNLVYCHENQFFYPDNSQQDSSKSHRLEQQMIQIYNFECADQVIFNSNFNRRTCLSGMEALLRKLPDHVPKDMYNKLKQKSLVLPIPLNDLQGNNASVKDSTFTLVWNHRWEYDKGLLQLESLISKIIEKALPCRIHLLGQQFRNIPENMSNIISMLKQHNMDGHIGFVENKESYFKLLQQSHLVLSTSLHEFQGLAVMEAVQQGCLPVLPNRLSYPEFFSENFLYQSYSEQSENDNIDKESEAAYQLINGFYEQWKNKQLTSINEAAKNIPEWHNKKAAYQQMIDGFL